MIYSCLRFISLIFLILTTFNGCTLIRIGHESAEKIKTTSSSGFQNGIKPENIRNVKDYIVNENDFVIIAENTYKTLYKTRNESTMGRLSILDDLVDYCTDIKGELRFGKQFSASMARDYQSIDLEFSDIKNRYKRNRLKGYNGWMKCINSKDNFEITRKNRSKYFLIEHEKAQLQGYSLQWYIDYFDLDELNLDKLNIGIWSYSTLVQLGGKCFYNKGKAFISNRYTDEKEISLNQYFLQQLDPRNKKKPYLISTGTLSCKESPDQETDFIFDITYAKKYKKIIFTKRIRD